MLQHVFELKKVTGQGHRSMP